MFEHYFVILPLVITVLITTFANNKNNLISRSVACLGAIFLAFYYISDFMDVFDQIEYRYSWAFAGFMLIVYSQKLRR